MQPVIKQSQIQIVPVRQSMLHQLIREDEGEEIRMTAYAVIGNRKPEILHEIDIDAITLTDLTEEEANAIFGGLMAVLKRRERRLFDMNKIITKGER